MLFIIYVIFFFKYNTKQLTVGTVHFLFNHHKENLFFFLPPPRRGLWFWLAGTNASPLNQNQDLPSCSCTWKEKPIKKKSLRLFLGSIALTEVEGGGTFFFIEGGVGGVGNTITDKRRLTADKVKTYGLLRYTFPSEWVRERIQRQNGA